LYPQKEINNREFREWNKKQKEIDEYNLILENKKRKAFLEEKRIFRNFRLLFKEKRYMIKLTDEEKRIKELERCSKYKEANWKKLSLTSKRWLEKNREKRYEYLKAYKLKNKRLYKQKQRLAYWRVKQKLLADQYLKNKEYETSTIRFYPFSPTLALCELL